MLRPFTIHRGWRFTKYKTLPWNPLYLPTSLSHPWGAVLQEQAMYISSAVGGRTQTWWQRVGMIFFFFLELMSTIYIIQYVQPSDPFGFLFANRYHIAMNHDFPCPLSVFRRSRVLHSSVPRRRSPARSETPSCSWVGASYSFAR